MTLRLAVPAADEVLQPEAMPAETDPPAPPLQEPRRLLAREVIEAVSEAFEVSIGDLKGPRRHGRIVLARQIAMMLCGELCDSYSMPMLGREFGGKDHTTVLHAVRVAPYRIKAAGVEVKVEVIRERMKAAVYYPPSPSTFRPAAAPPPKPASIGRAFPSVKTVQRVVARYYLVDPDHIAGRCRDTFVQKARQVAYYLAAEVCQLSLPSIALHFDGRHPSTAYEGRDAVQARMLVDPHFSGQIAHLLNVLNEETE